MDSGDPPLPTAKIDDCHPNNKQRPLPCMPQFKDARKNDLPTRFLLGVTCVKNLLTPCVPMIVLKIYRSLPIFVRFEALNKDRIGTWRNFRKVCCIANAMFTPTMTQSFRKVYLKNHRVLIAFLNPLRWVLALFCLILTNALSAQPVVIKPVAILGTGNALPQTTFSLERTFVGKVTRVADEQLKEKFGSASFPFKQASIQYRPSGQLKLELMKNVQAQVSGRFKSQFERLSGDMRVLGANYAIFNLDIEHGLASNEVSILQFASNGDVWIGYRTGGVSCLRGQRIMHLGEREGFDNSEITSIQSFGEAVWIGSFGGGLYRVCNGVVERFRMATGFPTDHILSMAVFDDVLWIGTYGSGIIRYDGSKFFHSSQSPSLPQIIGYMAADNHHLYLGSLDSTVMRIDDDLALSQLVLQGITPVKATLSGLKLEKERLHLLYDGGDNVMIDGSIARHYALPMQSGYQAMCTDHRGGIWIGSAMGSIWQVEDNRVMSITHAEGLSRSGVQTMGEDAAGNVWIGSTRHGIFIVARSAFQVVLSEENPLFTPTGAIESYQDGLLVHTKEGISLLKADKSILHIRHRFLAALNDLTVMEDKIWAVSYLGLMELSGDSLFLYHKSKSTDNGINTDLGLTASRDGHTLVISNYNYGYLLWDTKTQEMTRMDSASAFSLCNLTFEDGQGRLWIGSLKGGVCFVEDGRRTVLANTYGEVHAFAEDKLGNIWIGTKYGLLEYGTDGRLSQHSFSSAAAQNEIRSLLYVPQMEVLWAGTAAGLWSYDLHGQRAQRYGTQHGIGGTYFEKNAALLIGHVAYWVNNRGLLQYDFGAATNTVAPQLQLTGIDVHRIDSKTDWVAAAEHSIRYDTLSDDVPTNLSLTNDASQIFFYFSTGGWFAAANHILYYQVEGDDTWIRSADNHVVVLDGLRPRRYVVRFKVVSPDGQESNVVPYTFEIRKPFYLEAWFIVLCAIFGGMLCYSLIRRAWRIKFENIRSYSDRDAYLKRMRLMGILLSVAMPGSFFAENQLGVQGYGHQMHYWLILIFMSGIVLWVSTYVRQLSFVRLRQIVLVSATSMMLFVCVYTDSSSYAPTFTIGFIVMFCFASIILDSLRAFATFALFTAAMLGYLLIWVDTNNPNHLLFLTNFPFAFLFGGTYHILQLYRISNILFADKVLSVYDKYVLVCNQDGQVVYCNEFVTNELGVPNEHVLGTGWWRREPLESRSAAQIALAVQARVAGDTTVTVFEKQLSLAGFGQARAINWEYQVIEGGYLMGIGTDVTERIEQDLRIKTLSLVASTTENLVVITGLDRKIEWVNQSFIDATGYTLEEAIGLIPSQLLQGPETDQTTVRAMALALSAGQTFKGEILNYHKSGKPYWVMIVIQPIFEEDGRLVKFASLSTDITVKKLKELEMIKAVADSEQKYKLIAENTSDGIAILEPDGRFVFVSPSFLSILGYPASMYLNADQATIADSIHAEDRKIPMQAHARALAQRGESASYTYRIRNVYGEYIWQEDSATFVYDAAGNHEKTYLIARDVTQRILREREREQLLKELTASYEELKQFAFITQHNLRAPVANFLGLIELIEGEHIDHPVLPQFISAMRVTAERFDETIRDLNLVLSIKSRANVTFGAVDLESVFQSVCETHAAELAQAQVRITADFSLGPVAICNEGYLQSIFDIMVRNALQFAAPDRTLEIQVKSRHLGKQVRLTFSDNGLGLNLEVHGERLFGLYQRFHAHTKGKGLGLFLLKSQIEAAGGSVVAESMAGHGFELHITLHAPANNPLR